MRTRSSLLLVAATLALACGGGTPAADGGVVPDTGTGRPVPFDIAVSIQPARAEYRLGQAVRILAAVTDVDGTPIDIPLRYYADPAASATQLDGAIFELAATGYVELFACTEDPGPMGEPLCDYRRIIVSEGAPELVVTSPAPGAELGGPGESVIVVEGSIATGRLRQATVYVNGVPATVDAVGTFRAEVVPVFGINHLDVSASDGLTDVPRVRMDVLWADAYAPATEEGRPSVVLPQGITLQLGQPFFDDGVALDRAADPLVTRDLADVFSLLLYSVDFRTFLPDPLISSGSSLFLRVTDTRIADLDVSLDVVDGGADLFVRIGALEADTEGMLDIDGTGLSLNGGLSASLSAYARLLVSKADADAPLEASVEDLTIAIEGIEGRFADPEANAVLRLAESFFRRTLEAQLADAFGDTLLDAIPAVLTDALGSLDTALRDQTIEIDTDIFPPVTLLLDGRLAGLSTEFRRFMRAPLQFSVRTTADVTYPDSRGAAVLTAAADPLFRGRAVQMGIEVTLLNGLLHALWNSGMLEVDASGLLPEGVRGAIQRAELSGKLPPVIRPARATEPYDLMLALGQAELVLEALGDTTRYGLTLEAGVNATLVDGSVSLEIAEEPFIRTWIIESTAERPLIDDESLRAILRSELWPQLRAGVSGGLGIDLPSISLGELGTLAPELAGFGLSFELEDRLDVRENSLVLDVGLIGRPGPVVPGD